MATAPAADSSQGRRRPQTLPPLPRTSERLPELAGGPGEAADEGAAKHAAGGGDSQPETSSPPPHSVARLSCGRAGGEGGRSKDQSGLEQSQRAAVSRGRQLKSVSWVAWEISVMKKLRIRNEGGQTSMIA